MSIEDLIPVAILGSVLCIVLGTWDALRKRAPAADVRLKELCIRDNRPKFGSLEPAPAAEEAPSTPLFEKAVPAISRVLDSGNVIERNILRQQLDYAGFHAPQAVPIFLAIKTVLMISLALLASGGGLAAWGLSQNSGLACLVGAAVGLFVPNLVLKTLGRKRQQRLFLTLPSAIDLLVICIEVGRSLDQAIRDVAQEMTRTAPELCSEFELTCRHLQLGRARAEAIRDLGSRCGVDDLNALGAVLIQAERFGTGMAAALRELSEGMRLRRRQLAEEVAQKTAVKLLFPLVLFIFPGIFVVLVGPAAISVINEMLTL